MRVVFSSKFFSLLGNNSLLAFWVLFLIYSVFCVDRSMCTRIIISITATIYD